jgi:hypothetical protein
MTLKIERDAARSAIETERHAKEDALKKAAAEFAEESKVLHQKLASLEREHANLVAALKHSSEQKEGTLHDQVQHLTMENVQLREAVRNMQETVLQLALTEAAKGVEDAREGIDSDVITFLVQRIKAAREANLELRSRVSWSKGSYVTKSMTLARTLVATIMSAQGTAQLLSLDHGMLCCVVVVVVARLLTTLITACINHKGRHLLELARAAALAARHPFTDVKVHESKDEVHVDPKPRELRECRHACENAHFNYCTLSGEP